MAGAWDYYVKDIKFDPEIVEDHFPNGIEAKDLSYLGSKGWELVQILSFEISRSERCVRYYYKRERL